MSSEYYSLIVTAPIDSVLNSINEPANWLPFLPGFKQLIPLTSDTYQVSMLLSLGSIERETILTFYFTPSSNPNQLAFDYSSKNKSVTGSGKLILSSESIAETQIEIFLDLRLKGKRNLLLAPMLASVKRKWAQDLLTQMKQLLEN
ncbi:MULTISPECIES: SRPBCC family protein [Carnobacterium]|uniref:SRPBCC domain-containing protein n=1 Tax=Carnobacterium antarcticum TaxID=2126436 RepID=A0ABW4NMM6_9LACT|nr:MULTISPECIES: SRPBCC family protein [unclassified Carnobacterium]ALV20800.1 hypothetical protein NY10_177 [Carnobacterium sp. CP1]QQP70961.1 SRPBCC family protein [Carnobacterium sp. CS13]